MSFFSKYFYKDMGLFRYVGVYVFGDAYILAPFLIISLPVMYFLAGWFGVGVFWCVFMIIRNFIEIIYWLFQQFGDKSFRPPFPMKSLDNNQVYILYQLLNTVHTVIYVVILIFLLRG